MKHNKDFTALPNSVLLDKRLKQMDKLVFWAINSFAFGKRTFCFPSEVTLSQTCLISVSTVKRSIKNLTAFGYVKVARRGKMQTNVYEILLGSDSSIELSDSSPMNGHSESDSSPMNGHSERSDSSSMTPVIVHLEHGDSSPVNPEALQGKKDKEKKEGEAPVKEEEAPPSGASLPAETKNTGTLPSASTADETGKASTGLSGVTPGRSRNIERVIQMFSDLCKGSLNLDYSASTKDNSYANQIIEFMLQENNGNGAAARQLLIDLILWLFVEAKSDSYHVQEFLNRPCLDKLNHWKSELLYDFRLSKNHEAKAVERIDNSLQKWLDLQELNNKERTK